MPHDAFKQARAASTQAPRLQQTLCHFLIKETAEGMAGACYDALAKHDAWYKANPSRSAYIRSRWPMLIDEARSTLTHMLTLPLQESLKDEIADALIADKSLPRRTKRRTLLWPV